jgi:hypothetical protein
MKALPKETVMKVTGGCHCGNITYKAEVDPTTVGLCQHGLPKADRHGISHNIASLPETFRLKSGRPKSYIKTAESGNKRAHAFGPECDAPVYAAAPEPNASTYGLLFGALDQRANLHHQSDKSGAVRLGHGRWTCERSRRRISNNRRS